MTVGETIAALALYESNGDRSVIGCTIYSIDITQDDYIEIAFVDANTRDIVINRNGEEV